MITSAPSGSGSIRSSSRTGGHRLRHRAHVPRIGIVAAAVAAALAGAGLPASAAIEDDVSWGIRTADTEQGQGRANFSYVVDPGETLTDAVIVTNQGGEELTVEISTADGYTASDATLAFDGPEASPEGVGAWITPRENAITLRPGESREVEFTLAVPDDAPPGDQAGGIFTMSSTVDGSNIQINRRLGLRVHVRVSGDQVVDLDVSEVTYRHTASLNPVAAGTALVTYTVRNDGSMRTYFAEDITVSTVGSSSRHSTIVEEILPGSEITRMVELEAWPWFRSTVEVTVMPTAIDGTPGEGEVRTAAGWVVPWTAVAALLVVVAGAVAAGVLRARRSPGKRSETPV